MRFVQLTNFPGIPTIDSFAAHFVHSAVAQTGEVNFGGGHILDSIQHCTKMASLSNLMDVPTDCPQARWKCGPSLHRPFTAQHHRLPFLTPPRLPLCSASAAAGWATRSSPPRRP